MGGNMKMRFTSKCKHIECTHHVALVSTVSGIRTFEPTGLYCFCQFASITLFHFRNTLLAHHWYNDLLKPNLNEDGVVPAEPPLPIRRLRRVRRAPSTWGASMTNVGPPKVQQRACVPVVHLDSPATRRLASRSHLEKPMKYMKLPTGGGQRDGESNAWWNMR